MVATRLAVESINTYLQEKGASFRFSYKIYDTKLDTTQCINAITTAVNTDKISYFIGPQSSAELSAIRSKVDQAKLFVMSQGSTASSLSIPGDAIFRFCPGDRVEGKAIARTMSTKGKTYVITVSRNDAGGKGLQDAVGSFAQSYGARVDAITPYPITTTDFNTLITTLKTKIRENTAIVGSGKIAVFLASFDEARDLFRQAANDADLTSVDWYGCDGVVLSDVLLMDSVACSFAQKTNFVAPNFAVPLNTNADHDRIASSIKTATSIEPDAYALSVYDALWVLARTLSGYADARKDLNVLKTYFPKEANQYYGITGPLGLDANGDRNIGTFDYFGIRKSGTQYVWTFVGKSE